MNINDIQVALRRWRARTAFEQARKTVYEGIYSIEHNSAAAIKPTWADVFGGWASRHHSRNKALAQVFRDIQKRLKSGASLSEALKPYVPVEDFMVIDAGEASNRLGVTFEALLKNFGASKQIKKASSEAYRDPLIAAVACLLLALYSGGSLWPILTTAIPRQYWGSWALAMVDHQVSLYEHWPVLTTLIALIVAYKWSLSAFTGRGRQIAEQIWPPYKSFRDRQAAMFVIVLAGLLRAGRTLDQAMQHIAARATTPYLRWHARLMQRRIALYAGQPEKMLATGLISPQILDRIANAATTRNLSESLQYIGMESIQDVVDEVTKSAVIGANLLYLIAGLYLSAYAAVTALGVLQASDAMGRAITSQLY